MSVAPTGIVSLPIYYAQLTLAASTACQALLGQSSAAGALSKMFLGETDENSAADERPRMLTDMIDDFSREKVSTTGFLGAGTVEAVFEIPTPPQYAGSVRDARGWFYNQIGLILADVEALAGSGGYLNIVADGITAIGRADPKDNDGVDFWVACLDLKWQG